MFDLIKILYFYDYFYKFSNEIFYNYDEYFFKSSKLIVFDSNNSFLYFFSGASFLIFFGILLLIFYTDLNLFSINNSLGYILLISKLIFLSVLIGDLFDLSTISDLMVFDLSS